MLKSKGTNFLSEINAFFKNNDTSKAMNIFINTSNLIDYEKIKARSIRTGCGSDQSK